MTTKKRIDIEARTKGFDKAKKESKGLSKSLGGLKKSLMGAAAGYFAAQGLIAGIKGSLDAYAQQELAEKKLRFALQGNTKALTDQAAALQRTTTFGDEAIITQQAFLASLGMTQSQIMDILPVAADLAAATGMTLESAVRNTAKTFSGLAGELGELVPQLRDLTAEEMKAGKAVEVMAELFGGSAAADADTYTGSIKQLGNAFGDLKESIGKSIAPAVKNIVDGLKSMFELTESENLQKQQKEFLALTEILRDTTVSTDTRKRAMERLNKEYKPYLQNLDLEKASLEEIEALQKRAAEAFNIRIREKVLEEDMTAATEERIQAELELFRAILSKQESYKGEIEFGDDLFEILQKNQGIEDFLIKAARERLETAIEEERQVKKSQESYLSSIETKKKNNSILQTEKEFTDAVNIANEISAGLRKKTSVATVEQTLSLGEKVEQDKEEIQIVKQQNLLQKIRTQSLEDWTGIAKQTKKMGFIDAQAEWQLTLTMAIVDAAASMLKAGKKGGLKAALAMGAVAAPNLATIYANKPKVAAQTGFEGVIDEPTQFTVGEGGAAEYISVQPMEGVNNAGGTGVTVNISGNVMTQEFVEEELADKIAEAVRKGVAFA